MLFNSAEFFIFFILAVSLYFVLPHKFRWIFLLLSSYYFYMCWNPAYIILIVISTVIDYCAGLLMGKTGDKRKRRKYLILSLISNLGLLFTFKYFNFFNDSLRFIFENLHFHYNVPALNVLLPVGISFYTFQTLSYTIDVYRGHKQPEKHFGIFALYVSFFPQLVAGPIERSTRLLPQFYRKVSYDYVRVTSGLRLILWGLFKKVVIADRIAYFVNLIYNDVHSYQGWPLLIATVLFAFQIYCDFSGYSDIAIGTARILGFGLMKNFDRPYFSKSISEFWKRWHISLSSWFRDYVYIPLGGNRVVKWRWYMNLFIVFLVSGLWHGANWTFVIWGSLHGFYMLFSIWSQNIRNNITHAFSLDTHPLVLKCLRLGTTFSLVCFSWIFFRANSLSDALYIIKNMFNGLGNQSMLQLVQSGFNVSPQSLLLVLGLILIMESVHFIQRNRSVTQLLLLRPEWQRALIYAVCIIGIVLLGEYSSNQFIYFQF